MNTPLENDFPTKLVRPAQRALAAVDIQSLAQLSQFSEAQVKQLHGIGPSALVQLRRALVEKGLSFTDGQGINESIKSIGKLVDFQTCHSLHDLL